MTDRTSPFQVSAGAVLIGPNGKIAIVSQHGKSWGFPKGHLEPGEGTIEGALREVHEETGVDPNTLQVIKELGSYQRMRMDPNNAPMSIRKQIHLYIMRTSQLQLKPIDGDNPDAKWVDADKVTDYLTFEPDRQFYRQHLAEIKQEIGRIIQ